MADYLLQMQWDAILLRAWRENWSMRTTATRFLKSRGLVEASALDGLDRIPIRGQWHMPARAFVASALPQLSDMLWAGLPDAKLLAWMDESGLKSARPNRSIWGELRKEQRKQDRVKGVDIHDGHRRSDWHICKT